MGELKLKKTGVKSTICLFIASLILGSFLVSEVYAITNGNPDGDEHPYVGLIVFFIEVDEELKAAWTCTGSLISPTVMVCAGHCTTNGVVAAGIYLSPGPLTPLDPFDHFTTDIYTHPFYACFVSPTMKDWISHDVGVIILPEPVILSEYAELPDAEAIDDLPMKQDVDLVGYGFQERMRGGGQPVWVGQGTRMYASAQLINNKNAMSDEFVRITQNPGQGKGGTTFGDSGGPVLLAGTNTMIAVCSWGTNYNSAGVGYYSRLDKLDILQWIEDF